MSGLPASGDFLTRSASVSAAAKKGGVNNGKDTDDRRAVRETLVRILIAGRHSHQRVYCIRAVSLAIPIEISGQQGRNDSLAGGLCQSAAFQHDSRRDGRRRNQFQGPVGPREFSPFGAVKRSAIRFPLFRRRPEWHVVYPG